ncbi:MAG: response regulator transcription factor [Bacteroidales bacterium]|nr:response regulator transcription factor [Bacteroidales bacterium]
MNKTKIVIIENDNEDAKTIQNLLEKCNYKEISIISSSEKALNKIEKNIPDIILINLDLEKEMNGIQIAEIVKQRYKIPIVFIINNIDENIIKKAKEIKPCGLIFKPFNEKAIYATLEIAFYKHNFDLEQKRELDIYKNIILSRNENQCIFIKTEKGFNKIKLNDIFFIEALKNYVIINVKDKIFTTHSTMMKIQKILPKNDFIRVHRSFIVRIDKIFSIKYPNLVIEDKMQNIPIGGIYKKELYERLNIM